MNDEKIIDLFLERSEQAINELSKKYGRLCHNVALNIVKNEADAEECVNDAYLKIWNAIPPTVPKSLTAYACGMVRYVAMNRYVDNNAKKRSGALDTELEELLECFDSSYSLEDTIDERQFTKALDEFLRAQKQRDRVVFIKRYFYCSSLKDIAKQIGQSPASVGMRLSRIREKLKKFLTEKGFVL